MTDMWTRLKNARLVRVLGVYVAASWVVLQAIGLFMETMGLPPWTMPVALVLLGVGLVVVLATAWVQSRPGMEAAEAAEEVPDDWELGVREIGSSIRAGRMPHLNWARAIAAGVIALAILVGVAAIYRIRPGSLAAGEISNAVVATMPFTVRGSDEVAELGDGMVNLLGTKLDGAGELRSVDARALLAAIGPEGADGLDPSGAAAVARRFGAGSYVLGEVTEAGGRIRIDAALYRTENVELVAEASAEGAPDEFFGMVDQVAAEILGNLSAESSRVDRIAAVTTSSLPALKEYLTAERAFRAGEYATALEHFQAAVAEDSLFALAYYRLATASEYATRNDLSLAAAEKAQRLSDRLSERDRALLDASAAFRRGDADDAERRYRAILGRYPDDVLAWFELAEILFHLNPLRGRPGTEAREAFHRVLSYEPDDGPAMIHLIRIEASEGNLVAMDSLIARFLPVAGEGERGLEVRAIQAFAHDDESAAERVLAELAEAPDAALETAAWSVVMCAGDLAEAERVIRLMMAPSRSPTVQAQGHLWLAHRLLAGGQVAEAREAFRSARSVAPPAAAAYYEAVAAALPFLGLPDAAAEELRAFAAALPSEPTGATLETRVLQGEEAQVRAFVEGLAAARLGRAADARAARGRLVAMGGPREAPSLGDDLARTIAGYEAWRAGAPDEALTQLEGMEMSGGYFLSFFSTFHSHAFARWVRASALEDAGRGAEADRWYATMVWTSPYEIIYRAPAELARGRIAEAAGDRAGAVRHYERFVELWSGADPALQPRVAEARQAIARLRSR